MLNQLRPDAGLELAVFLSWSLLSGTINLRWDHLNRVLESFGAELPSITRYWLTTARPLFIIAFAVSFSGLLLNLADVHPRGTVWATKLRLGLISLPGGASLQGHKRMALWVGLAGAVATSAWSLWALFAPMMCCTLVSP